MPVHREKNVFPYSAAQLFALVADVERYPEFLPWCRGARILARGPNEFTAELIIHFKGFTERYTSRVTLSPPQGAPSLAAIGVTLVRGPFHHLENHWKFTEISHSPAATEIDFFLDFAFRSRLLEGLIGGMFARASAKMVGAFAARAAVLYGGEGQPARAP